MCTFFKMFKFTSFFYFVNLPAYTLTFKRINTQTYTYINFQNIHISPYKHTHPKYYIEIALEISHFTTDLDNERREPSVCFRSFFVVYSMRAKNYIHTVLNKNKTTHKHTLPHAENDNRKKCKIWH